MKELLKYINSSKFIADFTTLNYNSSFRQKAAGIDSNGNSSDFTKEEKKAIIAGLKALAKKFSKIPKNKLG